MRNLNPNVAAVCITALVIVMLLMAESGRFGSQTPAEPAKNIPAVIYDNPETDDPLDNPQPPTPKHYKIVSCPICEGFGTDPRDKDVPCFGCNKKKYIPDYLAAELSSINERDWPYVETKYYDCPMCYGSGVLGGVPANFMDIALDGSSTACTYCNTSHKVTLRDYRRLLKVKMDMQQNGLPVDFMPPL